MKDLQSLVDCMTLYFLGSGLSWSWFLTEYTTRNSAVFNHDTPVASWLSSTSGGRGMTPLSSPLAMCIAQVPSVEPETTAFPRALQAAQLTSCSRIVLLAPLPTSHISSLPESRTIAKYCSKSGEGFGRSARIVVSVANLLSASLLPRLTTSATP